MSATQAPPVRHSPDMPAHATEDQMLRWLSTHYRVQGWAAVPQVTVAMHDLVPVAGDTLAVPDDVSNIKDRRIDLLIARRAKNPDRCGPLETMAIEVKVTRADFAADVKDPSKQEPWRQAATRHAYAVPAGLVRPEECPPYSGLAWVHPPAYAGGVAEVEWVVRAPFIDGHKPRLPFRVLLTMLYRLSTFEATTRGWHESPAGAKSEQDLRAELTQLRVAIDKQEKAIAKAQDAAASWKLAYSMAAPDGVPCKWCGNGLKPVHPGHGTFREWRHTNPEHAEACVNTEVRAMEQEARDAYDTATDVERDREMRRAHRYAYAGDVEAQPWRAFLPTGFKPSPVPKDMPTA